MSNNKSKIHNITEYKFAVEVLKELPVLLNALKDAKMSLKDYRKYVAAQSVVDALDESIESVEHSIRKYKNVVTKKGAKGE